ncbi:MAG: bacteriocin family protein [Vicinamibacteria bacterium]|nr:bacteriocin family protein [Vicinamibacteria bacterium]
MDILKREQAPITPEAWKQIDAEARRVLEINLAGRKLVDLDGPHGWQYAGVNTGHLRMRSESGLGVPWGIREVLPLIEVRVPFELPIQLLDNASRGAILDLPAVVTAAEKAAHAEDNAIFNGFKPGAIEGIIPTSAHPSLAVPDDYANYPLVVVDAVETLRRAGINGPYALALGPVCYAGLAQAAQDGYPIRQRVEHFLDGPMVLAPMVDGAVLLSHRGGDFQLSVGQDLSVGYSGRDQEKAWFYLTESFTFRVLEQRAAVCLKPKGRRK